MGFQPVTAVGRLYKSRRETAVYKRRNNTEQKHRMHKMENENTKQKKKKKERNIKGILNNKSRVIRK